jgi:hypothetical protein
MKKFTLEVPMPKPGDGKPGTIVPPATPELAHDADEADPGQVEQVKETQRQTGTGKYGHKPVNPYKPPQTQEEMEAKRGWIEIMLVDEEDNPVPGEVYRITLPDDTVAEGTLDENGFARVNGIVPGNCKVTFPQRDEEAWEKAEHAK